MSEMVERVAVVLCKQYCEFYGLEDDTEGQALWLALARAAIAAMREPTEDMIKASRMSKDGRDIWCDMVGAALEPVDDDVDERVK